MEKVTYSTNSGKFIADKLLPCPFCGGEPELITIGNDYTKSRKAKIKCTKCRVERTTGAITNDLEWCGRKAIEIWNERWQGSSDDNAALTLHDVIKSVCPKCGKELKPIFMCIDCVGDEMRKRQTVL